MPTTETEKVIVVSDDEYFASLDAEEKKWYEEHAPDTSSLSQESTSNCTSCGKSVVVKIGSTCGIIRHPLLGVIMCMTCKRFYKDGSGWQEDEDGYDKYCRWCGQGGELILCDKQYCPAVFCKRCLQRNLGREKYSKITNSEEWSCLVCNPIQIYKHKVQYYSLYRLNKSPEFQRQKPKDTRHMISKRKSDVLSRKAENILQSQNNFIEENIGEALKTLSIYQKCLERERKRWIKQGRRMDVSLVTVISKSLRKIYSITRQNMDILDKAIVQSYIQRYPKFSTSIEMKEAVSNLYSGNKRLIKNNKKTLSSIKHKVSKKKETIVIRGKPVFAIPKDSNNNVDPTIDGYSTMTPAKKESSSDISFPTCMTTRIESESSDWSDLEVTIM